MPSDDQPREVSRRLHDTRAEQLSAQVHERLVPKLMNEIRNNKEIEIERFSLTSSKPFDQVVAALDAGIGHPDMSEFAEPLTRRRSLRTLRILAALGA